MAKATKTTRRTKTAETTSVPDASLPALSHTLFNTQGSKDVHLEKDNHKVCFHCHNGNPPISKNTVSMVEYRDGKIVSSDRLLPDNVNNAVVELLEDGYKIVHPTTPDDHA